MYQICICDLPMEIHDDLLRKGIGIQQGDNSIAATYQYLLALSRVPHLSHVLDLESAIILELVVIEVKELDKFLENKDKVHGDGTDCYFDGFLEESVAEETTHLLVCFYTVHVSEYFVAG